MNTSTFFNALKWSVAAEFASKAVQPLVFVILARLLNPEDYGVAAGAIMVISFTQIFWEAGMSKAIIQKKTDIDNAATVAFWINVTIAVIISIIIFLFSEIIADVIFHDLRVSDVLRVMTIQIVLGAFSSVHTALLQKEMKFRRLFWVRITTIAIPGFFSIPLAYYGMSYWALVVGTIVGQIAQVITLWKIERWRPHFAFNFHLAKDLGRFGFWVGLYGLLAWFYIWMDSLFVGAYLGTYHLGLYRTGNQFISMIYGFFFAPLLPVLYSHFSLIQANSVRLKDIMLKIIQILAFVSIPLGFLLYALSNPIGAIIFGDKWKGIGFVIGVMALTQAYAWVVGANGELYRAMGKPSYETVIPFATLFLYIVGYFFSIKKGFETFVWMRFYLAIAGTFLHIFFIWKVVGLSIFKTIRMMLIASAIGLIILLAKSFMVIHIINPYFQIFSMFIFCTVIIGGLLLLFKREQPIKDMLWVIKNKVI